jgi:hypothetical protein
MVKNIEKLQKYIKFATINTGCNVKKQHSQSQMNAIPFYANQGCC